MHVCVYVLYADKLRERKHIHYLSVYICILRHPRVGKDKSKKVIVRSESMIVRFENKMKLLVMLRNEVKAG